MVASQWSLPVLEELEVLKKYTSIEHWVGMMCQ
jgi:hypothetical protein